jgi:hypothetical protein
MTRTRSLALVAALGAACLSPLAHADDVRGTLVTTVRADEVSRGGEAVRIGSLYEQLALEWRAMDVAGFRDVRLVVNGWGALRFSDDPYDDHDGDVALLFLEGRSGPLRLRLGRQHVVFGPGRMQLVDGVEAELALPVGLRAQGYFGATVNPRFAYDRGDWQGGGRLGWHVDALPAELGVGYAEIRRDGERIRQEVVADASALFGPAQLIAWGALDPQEQVTEARADLGFRISERTRLDLVTHYQRPHLLLARDSLFWIFGSADRVRYAVDGAIDATQYLTAGGSVALLTADGELEGHDIRARIVAYREPNHRSLIGLELGRLAWLDDGYFVARGFTQLQVHDAWRVTGDLHAYFLDQAVNSESRSVLGTLGLVWDVAPSWQLAATSTGGATPREEWLIDGMLRVAYGYHVNLGREVWP